MTKYYHSLLVTCYSWPEYQQLKKQKYERSNRNEPIPGKKMPDGWRKTNGSDRDQVLPDY